MRLLDLGWVLCVAAMGCQRAPSAMDKERAISAAIGGCQTTKKGNNPTECACIVRAMMEEMSPAEIGLWGNNPDLFDEDELALMVLRQALQCIRPSLVAACVGRDPLATQQCGCIADGLLARFSGDQLMQMREQMANGGAVSPEVSAIRLDCAARFPVMQ